MDSETPKPPVLPINPPPLPKGQFTASPPALIRERVALPVKRQIFKILGICFAALLGLGLVLLVTFQITRKDTEADYVFMCERLFRDLPAEGNLTIQPSDAEIEGRIQELAETTSKVAWRTRRLSPLAQRYGDDMWGLIKLQRNAPAISPILFGAAEAALGVYADQRKIVGDGGEKALDAAEKLWNAAVSLQQIVNDHHVLAVQLWDLSPQFSGPVTNASPLECSFAEHTPGFLEIQTRDALVLKNICGKELHNCVISVRFSDESGNSYVNLYFVPDWQPDERRVANYSNFDIPKDTVDGIVRVDVGLSARECSIQPLVLKKPRRGWDALD